MKAHRIIDSIFDEVCLIRKNEILDVDIGDNYDNYVGSIECSLNASEETINKKLREIF